MRDTSLSAYDSLISNGVIKGQLAAVARAVADHGPGTSAEILAAARMDGNRNLMRARFSELRDRGVIVERGPRDCAVTGRRAMVFEFAPEDARVPARRRRAAEWRQLALDAVAQLDQWLAPSELRARRDALLSEESNGAIAADSLARRQR